ncbi:hypothetical protein R9X50_00268400 [Acrodontium crateriforme]|uniref:Calmodulin n=1 Tax=Acrodontium crateriforme TaxID=150365 RepID=A0AAQ3R986_9PEZI|nr:hypothetical protein R9X50_00268400 [Acrodontium crateriforme]
MPPKRKQPAASAPSTTKAPSKRRSKLAKEHDITSDEEAEIQAAFDLFAQQDEHHGTKNAVIATADVRRCLVALNAPASNQAELQELLEVVDPENTGWVAFEQFIGIAAIKLNARDDDPDAADEEVRRAYRLFTKGEEREITLHDLKRVARELRENIPDPLLRDMIREATGGELGGVSMDDFESVMKRAGVFS